MATYVKQTHVDDTVLYADALNHIEEGIYQADSKADSALDLFLGGSGGVSGEPGQVVSFDSDGKMTPMVLLEDVTETETVADNMFDASAGYVEGYDSSAGPIDLETLEVPLDNPASGTSAVKLSKKLIFLEGNTTYAFTDWSGRMTLFSATTGARSVYVEHTRMTAGDNCLLYTTGDKTAGYYAAIHIHPNSPTAFEDMIIQKGSSISTDTNTVLLGKYLHNGIKVKAEQVEGLEDVDTSGGNDGTSASSDFDALYGMIRAIQNYQSPSTLTFSLMSDTHYDVGKSNAAECLKTARTMGLLDSYMVLDFIGNLGDMIPGDTDVEISRLYLSMLAQATNQNAKCPVFYARGNHDDNGWYSGGGMGGTYLTTEMLNDKEWYQAVFGISAKNLVIDPNKPNGGYGYYDHERSKIRVFVMNTEDLPYIVEDDGTYRYSSYNGHAFSNEQINFIANALYFADKDNPNEWAALFLSHVPLDTTNDDGYRFGIEDALIRNHEAFLAIVAAYRKGTSFSYSGSGYNSSLGDVSEDFQISVDVDYSSKGVGDVVGFISGHTHTDNFSRNVGYENSLSHGYAYIGLMGSTQFANFIVDRENSKIASVKYGTSYPDTTEGAAVDAPDTGSIASGEWSVNIDQFRPTGENLYNGISETYGAGYTFPSSGGINTDTLEMTSATASANYTLSKGVLVKPFTKYAIPTAFSGSVLAFGSTGGRSGYLTPAAGTDYKIITTGIRQTILCFSFHTSYDHTNFKIKEIYSGMEF